MSRKTLIFSGSTIIVTIILAILYLPKVLKERQLQHVNYQPSLIAQPTLVPTPSPTPDNKSSLEIAYDKKRQTDILNIINATYLYSIENQKLPLDFPTTPTCIGTSHECYNLGYLTPNFITEIPQDPQAGTDQNTGYYVFLDDGRLTATASGGIKVRK